MGKIENKFVLGNAKINMSIFAKIQFCLSSLTHLVCRVTFLQSEQLGAKFQNFISGQYPEFYGKITFFATKMENVKNGALNIKNVLNSTLRFSDFFKTWTAKSKLKFGSTLFSIWNM